MTATTATEVIVACKSWQEAQRIIDYLFEKALISAAECLDSGQSSGLFDAPANGVKVLLSTAEHLTEEVRREVQALI